MLNLQWSRLNYEYGWIVLSEKLPLRTMIILLYNKANLRDLIAATGLAILLKFDPNHRFFSPCDLEIWWMTSKNNRAPLLYYIKLCALFYHDVGEIFWPQPIRSLKLGHMTGQGSMSPIWVGGVSDLGKMAFIKSVKTWIILLCIWLHL